MLSVSSESPSLSLEGLRDAQATDENIQPVIKALTDGVKPPHDSLWDYPEEARILLAQWDSLVLENDVLYRRYHYPDGTTKYLQVVIPTALRCPYVERLHADIGHFSRTKSCLALARRAYFPGWRALTGMLVRNCPTCITCQWDNQEPRLAALGPMREFGPMAVVQADPVGPLPAGKHSRDQGGFQHFLPAVGSATRHLWLPALRYKTAGGGADPLADTRHVGDSIGVGRGACPCNVGSCTSNRYPPVPASPGTDSTLAAAAASSGPVAGAGGLRPRLLSQPVLAQHRPTRCLTGAWSCCLVSHCPVTWTVYDVTDADAHTTNRRWIECMLARGSAGCCSIDAVPSLFTSCAENRLAMADELVLPSIFEWDVPEELDMDGEVADRTGSSAGAPAASSSAHATLGGTAEDAENINPGRRPGPRRMKRGVSPMTRLKGVPFLAGGRRWCP